jgi:hypothetical protein
MQHSFASVSSQSRIDLLFAGGARRESITLVCLALAHVRVQPSQRVATFQQIQKELANLVYYLGTVSARTDAWGSCEAERLAPPAHWHFSYTAPVVQSR